jgi:CubicO group peptidase (beta-lactamase class C family)
MTRARTIGAAALAMAFGFGFSLKGEEGQRPFVAEAPPAAAASLHAFEEKFTAAMSEAGAVGAGLIVVRGSRVLLSSYFGLADREKNIPASPDTIWHWASITKTFTAVRLMQLRDRGKLALSDPIVKYVPELRAVHDPYGDVSEITLKHLLSHSAGFRSATFPWGGDKSWHPDEPARWEQLAAMLPYTEILFAPASKYAYSNPGIVFLGRTIEVLTRDDYEVAMDKDVFRPLGLSKAFYDRAPYHLEKDMARGYEGEIGALVPTRANFDSGITVSNGGLNAPLPALAAWLALLAGDGPQILSRASLEEMWTPVLPALGKD